MHQLYGFPFSQHSRRVVSLLEQAGIEYEFTLVDMMNGEHLSAPYLKINPNHQVPTLIDGDITIHESNAILRYLCIKHGLADWYPRTGENFAKVEQWLDWNQCRLSPLVVSIVLNKVFLGESGNLAAADLATTQIHDLFALLEEGLVNKRFIAGDNPTIADLSLASNIFQLGLADAAPQTRNILRWYDLVSALKGFQNSLPTSQEMG